LAEGREVVAVGDVVSEVVAHGLQRVVYRIDCSRRKWPDNSGNPIASTSAVMPDLMQANGFIARRRRCPVYRTADQRRRRKPRQFARGTTKTPGATHQINAQTERY
jgi:hypothetical protein